MKGIWKRLKISEILLEEEEISKKEYSFNEAIQAMVMNRLVHAASKLETWRWKDRVWEPAWEGLNLQHFYRAMDYLVERKDEIEKGLFEKRGDLFGKQLDLVLFDTTTIKYWGEASDSKLLRHGHSKEKRMDLRQIIVGVLMSKEGMPLAHEVWEGNQSDMESLKRVLGSLQDKYEIQKVVLVCDRGMVSKKNLQAIEEAGYEYIVGVKMRQFDETMKRNLLGIADFEEVREDLWVKDKKIEGRRYLVCYNPEEAKQDAKDREYFKRLSLQSALSSAIGLYMATSGCPRMNFLKPMAKYHLPFASLNETIYRSVSTYLLLQYFRKKKGQEPDWDLKDLNKAYATITVLNLAIVDRIRKASQKDANYNALIILDIFAKMVPWSIDQGLHEKDFLFRD